MKAGLMDAAEKSTEFRTELNEKNDNIEAKLMKFFDEDSKS